MNPAAIAVLTLTLIALAVLTWFNLTTPRDNTDPESARSGMTLLTDPGTGCHYLAWRYGGLTPRLDTAGRQVCDGGGS